MKSVRLAFFLIAAIAAAPFAAAEAPARDPHLVKAVELREQAVSAFEAGDYDTAAELARRAKTELALIQGTATEAATAPPLAAASTAPLPATYTVRLLPEDRDSLSKIAGYRFVYGDPSLWVILYKANKDTLKHPENADIIIPGEVLVIPSINGEVRDGDFDPSFEYGVVE